eukprot:CAMPEP_0185797684 /NCGR_PEP_ID=MMETSP1174-20130828/161746_1 /TAXON_ID=35687 /ORGANISM="Dictyocha speculum, Strain CCMP1381" /LENGTH=61 /DNA_ID=CAMNT_0028493131 /DNA_START=969 /DNA_END=1151 /DNA_ORIENTATION=+
MTVILGGVLDREIFKLNVAENFTIFYFTPLSNKPIRYPPLSYVWQLYLRHIRHYFRRAETR